MKIPNLQIAALAGLWLAAGSLLAAPFALAADAAQQGQGSAVITVLQGQELPGGIPQQALQLKVDGKQSDITGWTALRGPQSKVEVVVLIDDGARTSLGIANERHRQVHSRNAAQCKGGRGLHDEWPRSLAGPLTTDPAAVCAVSCICRWQACRA